MAMAFFTIFKCQNAGCGYIFSTEGHKNGRKSINDLKQIYTCLLEDKGYSGYRRFAAAQNITPLSISNYYSNCEYLYKMMEKCTEEHLREVHKKVIIFYKDELKVNKILGLIPLTVSLDGTYKKRGYHSNFAASFLIEAYSGHIIDYELSEKCSICPLKIRNKGGTTCPHGLFHGSSGSMEVLNAQKLFERGHTLGFRYDTLICDGDCKAYEAIKDTYDTPVQKEECKLHLIKRARKRMKKLFEDHRETVPNKTCKGTHIEKPFGGDEFKILPSKFGGFYSKAVIENKHLGVDAMSNAVKASFYHNLDHEFASNRDRRNFHRFCPKDGWCKFRKEGKIKNGHFQKLHKFPKAMEGMVKIYDDLSDTNLLERCKQNMTQNVNESFHSKIYYKVRKTTYHGCKRLRFCVNATILEHNEGFQASSFLPKLGPITRATKRTLALRNSESLRSALKKAKRPHKELESKNDASAAGPDYDAGMCL